MTAWLVVLPVVLPLAGAIVALGARRRVGAQRAVTLVVTTLVTAVAVALGAAVWRDGILAVQLGGWEAPLGIPFVADLLAVAMVGVTAVVALATAVAVTGALGARDERAGFHPLFLVLLTGVNGAFLTGDLFNLYVWFEVLLIASFALVAGGASPARVRGGVVYVALNLVGSFCFLAGVGLVYGMAGTLHMADLARVLPTLPPGPVTAAAGLFLVAFGLKAGVFPLFTWLPASYPALPTPVAAVFAGVLTKVGVYALLRTFTLLFTTDVGFTHTLLLWAACLTMLVGVLGAAAQDDVRRILSFHIVSQIGYMVLGLALWTPLALAGAVFYVVHHIIVKANLFLVGGLIGRVGGSQALGRTGGMLGHAPWVAALFAVPALSLIGIPPFSGFWAKLLLVQAALDVEAYVAVAVALVVTILTMYSMTKVWAQVFWKPHPSTPPERPALGPIWALAVPSAALGLLTIGLGLGAQGLLALAEGAAAQLIDPSAYIGAVFSDGRSPLPR